MSLPLLREGDHLLYAPGRCREGTWDFGAASHWAAGRTIGWALGQRRQTPVGGWLIPASPGSRVTSNALRLSRGPVIFAPEPLEIASQSLAAILATWLGLTVVSRAPGERAPRVFAWVSMLLVAWSVAILVERTTSDPAVARNLNALEDVAAFLLPAAALHIILAFTAEGPYPIWQSGALVVAYAVGAAMGIQQILDPNHPLSVVAPRLEPSWVSGVVLAWAWIAFRVAVFAMAVWLAARAYAGAGEDRSRRNQALAALVTIALASIGGTLRFLPREIGGPNWVGVSFITLALIVATYAVFGQGAFLSPGAIRNAFRYSLLAGLAVALYVGTLAILEASVEPILHTTLPIVMVLALVATVALLDPVRERLQRIFDPARSAREAARRRLGRALGINTLADQPPEVAIQPAIERLARYLRFGQALVSTTEGAALARLGGGLPDGAPALAVPLMADGRQYGEARFGPRLDGRPVHLEQNILVARIAGLHHRRPCVQGRRQRGNGRAGPDAIQRRLADEFPVQQRRAEPLDAPGDAVSPDHQHRGRSWGVRAGQMDRAPAHSDARLAVRLLSHQLSGDDGWSGSICANTQHRIPCNRRREMARSLAEERRRVRRLR